MARLPLPPLLMAVLHSALPNVRHRFFVRIEEAMMEAASIADATVANLVTLYFPDFIQ